MKGLKRWGLTGLIVLAGVVGCKNKMNENGDQMPAKKDVTQHIRTQNEAFSTHFQQADTAAFAKLYTSDGWMMPPNMPPVKGREGIMHFLSQAQKMGLSNIKLSTGEVTVTGNNSALETGRYKLFAGNGQQVDRGSYMVYWKKDGDTWRLFRDIWNSDMPPAGQQTSQKKQSQSTFK